MFLYVPLIFTCCTAPAQSLPMIALQYHDVKLSVKLNPIEQVSIFQSTGGSLRVKDAPQITATGAGINMSLVATYIFLDDAERRSVALSPHQFLMTEIQTQQFAIDPNASRSSYQLYFNHPITELFIYFSKNAYRDSSSTAVVNHYWNWTFDGPQVELSNYDATEAACEKDNPQGCEKNGLIWYPKCKAGFHAAGCCVCSPDCPAGTTDTGATCNKNSHGRGAGSPLQCGPGQTQDSAGLCYDACPTGTHKTTIGMCDSGCPDGAKDIGVSCARESYSRGVGVIPWSMHTKKRLAPYGKK